MMERYFTITIFLLGLSRRSNAIACYDSDIYLSYRSPDSSHGPCITCVKFKFTEDWVKGCRCEPEGDEAIDSVFFDDLYQKYYCSKRVLQIKNDYESVDLETGPSDEWSNFELLDLSENKITNITPIFFASLIQLRVLNLSKNNLTSVNNILTPLSMLQNLDLSRNNIDELDEPFKSLIDLFEINLSYNKLTKIPKNTFENQEHLETLLLNHNKIIRFEASLSSKPMSVPLELDLSWNEITNITLTRNVHSLDISHNNLSEFSINLSSSITFLNLSHNKIVKIGDSAMLKAVNLETIDLSFNYLSSFPTSSFKDQKILQYIDISNNLFSKNKFGPQDNWASFFLHCSQLQNVSLVNNLWTCSDLKDILQSLNSHSVSITHGDEHTTNNILGIKCIELYNDTSTPIDVSDISSRITSQVLAEVWERMTNYMNNISSRVSNLENNNMVDKLIEKIGNIEKHLNTDHIQKDDVPTYGNSKNTLQAAVLSELSSKIKDLDTDKMGKEKLLKNDLNTIEQLLRSLNDGANSVAGAIIQNLLLLFVLCVLLYFVYVIPKRSRVVTRENVNLV